MIRWSDNAFILNTTIFNERDLLVDMLSSTHGRVRGIARFGATSKQRALYQSGNMIAVDWQAKQAHQLGRVTAELQRGYLGMCITSRLALAIMQSANALCLQFLYEGDEASLIYHALATLFNTLILPDEAASIAQYCRFEIALLSACGFRLDLSHCAATGQTEDLYYISPKSGCAVSRQAGAPYHDKMLRFPRFYQNDDHQPTMPELLDALALNAYFLQKRLCADNQELPQARARLQQQIQGLAVTI